MAEGVYCDLRLAIERDVEVLAAVTWMREAGKHPQLDETFDWMQLQLPDSIV